MDEVQEVQPLPEGFREPINPSSNIRATKVTFNGITTAQATLEVIFHNNTRWKYTGVPKERALEMHEAESPGKFFNAHIKSNPQVIAEKVITEVQ